jgi:HK97 family phage major capsid protein
LKKNIFNDLDYDLWRAITPGIGQAFAKRLDAAIFSGTDKPEAWTAEAIVPAAIAAGNTTVADSTPDQGGIVNDIFEAADDPEADGFTATGIAAVRSLRGQLRRARDAGGQLLGEATPDGVADLGIAYAVAGSLPADTLAVVGEFPLLIIGVRQDMTAKVFDSGVVTDDTGEIKVNLMQEDKLALRVVARYGFNVAVPATLADAGAGTAYPFGVLTTGPTEEEG